MRERQTGLSTAQRVALVVGAVAVVVVAFVLLQGSSDDKPATTSTAAAPAAGTKKGTTSAPGTTAAPAAVVPTVRVVDAKPQGGIRKLTFTKGDRVRFRVVSDTADEIHVHGYDVMKDVAKGGGVTFSFPASVEGRFVVELESRGVQIAQLDVEP